jgi:hypothetical protein
LSISHLPPLLLRQSSVSKCKKQKFSENSQNSWLVRPCAFSFYVSWAKWIKKIWCLLLTSVIKRFDAFCWHLWVRFRNMQNPFS